MQISVIVPFYNEQDSIKELYDWLKQVLESKNLTHEILFVDDGSTDLSWAIVKQIALQDVTVRGLHFSANFGKSQALHAGFLASSGEVVVTMDADLQDSPDEIPELYRLVKSENFDLVCGWKKKRLDSYFSKNLPSKVFNWAARKISGLELHDFNCGLKAYKSTVVKSIRVRGEMHRYIPLLVKNAGYVNITEKVVLHQPRKYGTTKFGTSRFLTGLLDLISIWFISKFGRRPMYLFGTLGLIMFFLGFLLVVYLGVDKLIINTRGRLLTERPQFFVSLITMIMGTQFFLTGFLAEIILSTKNNTKVDYRISERM